MTLTARPHSGVQVAEDQEQWKDDADGIDEAIIHVGCVRERLDPLIISGRAGTAKTSTHRDEIEGQDGIATQIGHDRKVDGRLDRQEACILVRVLGRALRASVQRDNGDQCLELRQIDVCVPRI
jgi:hypothetical protein